MRGKTFSEDAKAFGLNPPKGVLLVGIPGCGKSLTAKCIASAWSMPLLKLDMGKIFGKYVGDSEANIRQALKTAEAIAPCVLWIDEIEKGLSGGGSDGGTSSRVFGNILTWMQDKTSPVLPLPQLIISGTCRQNYSAKDDLTRFSLWICQILKRERRFGDSHRQIRQKPCKL